MTDDEAVRDTSTPRGWTSPTGSWKVVADAARAAIEEHGARAVTDSLRASLAEALSAVERGGAASTGSADRGPAAAILAAARSVPARSLAPALLPIGLLAAMGGAGTKLRGAQREDRLATASPNGTTVPTEASLEDLLARSLEIPERSQRLGPLTSARQRRTFAVLGAMEVGGLSQAVSGKTPPGSQAFGLGLMVPGGGFLFTKDPALFALTVAAFATALVLWIGTGNHIAPPLVWLGAALWAAQRARGGRTFAPARLLVPIGVAAIVLAARRKSSRDFDTQREAAHTTNEYLKAFTPPLRGTDRPAVHVPAEMDDNALAVARRIVDIALQDADDWSNYDITEQFQPAAIRYQLNEMGWALSVLQYVRTPAFRGYVGEAQRNLINKYLQRRVWSYWFLENMWGNLQANPDPVRRQNVMLSGWYGLQVATYQSASGDMRYSQPGALQFKWDTKTQFDYSLTSICEAMFADMSKSPWSMMVCEPNWIYPICNTTAGNTFVIHDRMAGSKFWPQLKGGFANAVEAEMSRADGLMNTFKSSRTGYGYGAGPSPSTEMRPLVPNVADRGWALTKAGAWKTDADGRLSTVLMEMKKPLDYGNYSTSPVLFYGGLLEAAREVGEEDLAAAAWRELEERTSPRIQNGHLIFPDASLLGYGALARGLFGRKGGWLDLVERGLPQAWLDGPVLESVPYPEVMVARAVTDGDALEFVLRSTNGGGRVRVELSRLLPARTYDVVGGGVDTLTAASDGTATISIDVSGRAEVRVTPRT